MGKYSVRGGQYWPERSTQGTIQKPRTDCPILRNAIIDLLHDF